MKKTFIKTFGVVIVAFALLVTAVPSMALAGSSNDYGLGYDSYYYDYVPTYDYYTSYYQPTTDYYNAYDYSYPSYRSYDYPSYNYPSYDYNYPSYNYSTPSYDYPTYSYSTPSTYAPSSSPYPSYTYQYTTPSNQNQNTAGSDSSAVSNNTNNTSSNSTNSNSNNSSASNNNVNNNVNTNPISIVINNPIGNTGSTNNNNNPQTLDGYCVISPTNININQDVTFIATASGGTGSYNYSWTGSDGISSGSRTFTGRFSTYGSKTAYVTISSGSQSITRSCSVNVDQNNGNTNTLSAYCIANPSSTWINQTVTWTVYPTGGNSGYTYSWSGTDGLGYGNSQSVQKYYTYAGTKSAYVTVYSGGQSVYASCSATVYGGTSGGNVTVIPQQNIGTPSSGVYLSQVPDTGISFNLKVVLFVLGLSLWSAYAGYVIVNKKKNRVAFATNSSFSNMSMQERVNKFKLDNMKKRGLIR